MHKSPFQEEKSDTPMIEIFGGLFALLVVLLVVISLFTTVQFQKRTEAINTEGKFSIGLDQQSDGLVVIAHEWGLYLPLSNTKLPIQAICENNSVFIRFAREVYQGKGKQLIFSILEGGEPVMAIARQCLMTRLPNQKMTIGWMILDNELLKSIDQGDIPDYIERTLDDA